LNREDCFEEDQIDLKELFKVIWKKRVFILVFTIFMTLCSLVYVFFKEKTLIYKGKALIEIGEIQSESFATQVFDNPNNLVEILRVQLELDSFFPSGTTQLLVITSENKDKNIIENDLKTAIEFIIQRHKEKAKFYKNYIMTKQIGKINIDDIPINKPKKKLIVVVTFFTTLFLSVFIILFIDFITNSKTITSKDKND